MDFTHVDARLAGEGVAQARARVKQQVGDRLQRREQPATPLALPRQRRTEEEQRRQAEARVRRVRQAFEHRTAEAAALAAHSTQAAQARRDAEAAAATERGGGMTAQRVRGDLLLTMSGMSVDPVLQASHDLQREVRLWEAAAPSVPLAPLDDRPLAALRARDAVREEMESGAAAARSARSALVEALEAVEQQREYLSKYSPMLPFAERRKRERALEVAEQRAEQLAAEDARALDTANALSLRLMARGFTPDAATAASHRARSASHALLPTAAATTTRPPSPPWARSQSVINVRLPPLPVSAGGGGAFTPRSTTRSVTDAPGTPESAAFSVDGAVSPALERAARRQALQGVAGAPVSAFATSARLGLATPQSRGTAHAAHAGRASRATPRRAPQSGAWVEAADGGLPGDETMFPEWLQQPLERSVRAFEREAVAELEQVVATAGTLHEAPEQGESTFAALVQRGQAMVQHDLVAQSLRVRPFGHAHMPPAAEVAAHPSVSAGDEDAATAIATPAAVAEPDHAQPRAVEVQVRCSCTSERAATPLTPLPPAQLSITRQRPHDFALPKSLRATARAIAAPPLCADWASGWCTKPATECAARHFFANEREERAADLQRQQVRASRLCVQAVCMLLTALMGAGVDNAGACRAQRHRRSPGHP